MTYFNQSVNQRKTVLNFLNEIHVSPNTLSFISYSIHSWLHRNPSSYTLWNHTAVWIDGNHLHLSPSGKALMYTMSLSICMETIEEIIRWTGSSKRNRAVWRSLKKDTFHLLRVPICKKIKLTRKLLLICLGFQYIHNLPLYYDLFRKLYFFTHFLKFKYPQLFCQFNPFLYKT